MQSETGRSARPVVVSCVFCTTANRVDLSRLDAGPKCGECGRPLRLDRPLKVTDADFDRTIAGASVPVLVDFYADWCGPCRTMAPTFDELASDRRGEILVAKLDTDRNPRTAAQFEIRGIPTTIVFVQGQEAARLTGATARGRLDRLLQEASDKAH